MKKLIVVLLSIMICLLGVSLIFALETKAGSSLKPHPQRKIDRVELMPNIPKPFLMRDWRQVAIDYYNFVFDFTKTGTYLPLIWWDNEQINYERKGFGLQTYVGCANPAGGDHEAINTMGAVLGATMVNVDTSNYQDQDWVLMLGNYFNRDNKQNIFANRTSAVSGGSFWYEILPNVLMFQLFHFYPETENLKEQLRSVADRYYDALIAMGASFGPWQTPDFEYTGFDFSQMAVQRGSWLEPDAAGGVAWIQLMAWHIFGDEKYLRGAEWALQFLEERRENPLYEILMPIGAMAAARINAELGRGYDLHKMLNWSFGTPYSSVRRGWGVIADRWGDYNVDGLVGSMTDGGGYGFAMNTFLQAGIILPLVRYDDRYARAIGKWILNLANASRLFYGNGLPYEHQSSAGRDWLKEYDHNHVLAFEGLRQKQYGKRPAATGDPVTFNWGPKTNIGLYGSSYVGMLGGIIAPTNHEKILQLDVLKADFFGSEAYPTYLYYNPYSETKEVIIEVGDSLKDLYDAVTNVFIRRMVSGQTSFKIPADTAVLLVIVPCAKDVDFEGRKTYLDGKVIDFNNGILDEAIMETPAIIREVVKRIKDVEMRAAAAEPGQLLINARIELRSHGAPDNLGKGKITAGVFMGIPNLAADDYLQTAEGTNISLVEGKLSGASGGLKVLTDGLWPATADAPAEVVFFTAGGNGKLLIDLNTLVEVTEVNLYSRHKDNRTTQEYSVYGSKAETVTDFDPGNTEIWTFVGSAHSGHRQGDGGFNGVIGSSITAVPGTEIGQLRYLLLVIEDAPSYSGDGTFIAEIDVIITE